MLHKTARYALAGALCLALFSCGEDEDLIKIEELSNDINAATAIIDSLNYQVETSNILIDNLRAQVDSLDRVDAKLLAEVQTLSEQVKKFKNLYTEQQRHNKQLRSELERMKVEKQADKQVIAKMRSESDSLNTALLGAHTRILRQSDNLKRMQLDLAQVQDQLEQAKEAQSAVHVLVATEAFLKENGYLKTGRKLGLFGKSYKLVKKLGADAANIQKARVGSPLLIAGELKGIADRYGKLEEGQDYTMEKTDGQVSVTFLNDMLEGVDLIAVVKE